MDFAKQYGLPIPPQFQNLQQQDVPAPQQPVLDQQEVQEAQFRDEFPQEQAQGQTQQLSPEFDQGNCNPVSRQGDRGSRKNKSAKGTNRDSCRQRKKDLKQGNDLTLFVPLMLSLTNEQEELMKRKERTRG